MIGLPPKPKFTKDEITNAALTVAREKGIGAVSAREVAVVLGTSTRPIFTYYHTMDELKKEVRLFAENIFRQYVEKGLAMEPPFLGVGVQYLQFAQDEPKLYQLLFMQENAGAAGFSGMVRILGSTADTCMKAIRQDYGLEPGEARMLFENVWIYTFGVGALCATNTCRFSPEELGQMLTTEFQAMMTLLRSRQ